MTLTLTRWNLEDYHQLISAGLLDGRRVELLNGLLVEMPPESPLHAELNTSIAQRLQNGLGSQTIVRNAKPISLEDSEPEPDIALVRPGSYRLAHPGPADIFLLIEFAQSSLAKDTQEKAALYAGAGILDYWVADLAEGQLWVFRQPALGGYQALEKLTSGQISPLVFPDLSLSVAELVS
ncbi:MAG: Uma2 family endonuclease [Cyanobacteria bacterium RI_101]|nr:Uma2 family endonuclease [Cyanobacteria bacterium RI_101]